MASNGSNGNNELSTGSTATPVTGKPGNGGIAYRMPATDADSPARTLPDGDTPTVLGVGTVGEQATSLLLPDGLPAGSIVVEPAEQADDTVD